MPKEIYEKKQLSSLQLEAITYAAQSHEKFLPNGKRVGFLIGDGAGVGKGRQIAGSIVENYYQFRKRAVWISVSADLKYDAERDLEDVGCGFIPVHKITDAPYGYSLSSAAVGMGDGVLYSTYSSLIASNRGRGGR